LAWPLWWGFNMTDHVTDFTLSALSQDRLSGINDMMRSIGKTFNACACVLWELTTGISPGKNPTEEFLFGLAHWPFDVRVPSFKTPTGFVTSEVARTQETRNIVDVTSDPTVLKTEFLKSLRVKTMCSVPVRFLDGSRGALNVYKDVPEPLNGREVQELENFARLVPPLYRTIREKISFHLLQQVNATLNKAERQAEQIPLSLAQVKKVLEEICRHVADTFQCIEASIFLGDRLAKTSTINGQQPQLGEPISFNLQATTCPPDLEFGKRSYRKGEAGPTAQVLTEGRSLQLLNLAEPDQVSSTFSQHSTEPPWAETPWLLQSILEIFAPEPSKLFLPLSFIAAPILSGSRGLGVFRCQVATAAPYYLTKRDLDLLGLIARQIGFYC
jgi:GAF domain